jgi:phytanoyl-CoA hydroxylase
MPDFEPIECSAGTLVLLHGENVHYSAENTSPVSRHSWALHVVESAAPFVWAEDNWAHRRPEMPWTPLYDEASSSSSSSSSNVVSR